MGPVSVVIPSFNRADLLGATVRSVLAQSHPAAEIIVVDDGSTDATPEVCAAFPAPVRCIRQENRGLPAARNRGIEEARGEWIALCDSDDLWHPRKLEVQMAALAALPHARWSLAGCSLIDPDGEEIASPLSGFERVFPVFRERGITPYEHFARALELTMAAGGDVFHGDLFGLLFDGNTALPSSAVIARSLFDEVGAFDPEFRVAEETEFFHRAAAAAPVAIVMEPLVEYRVGHGSIISSGNAVRLVENAIRSLDRAARLRTLSPAEERAYAEGRRRLVLRLAYAHLSTLEPVRARAALREGGGAASRDSLGLLAASFLPTTLLRGLHWAKRRVRG